MGINIYRGYKLHEIQIDENTKACQTVIFRKNSDNYAEIIEAIALKKQEILERQENENDKDFEDNLGDEDEENI